jgi:sirohydrochlorin ferrochelatase
VTVLVTVAHGTRFGPGNEVAAEITAAAGRRLGLRAVASYVELCEPSFASVMTGLDEPAVAVPLLLSTGYHVRVDLADAVHHAATPVALGPALGPDPLLASAQVQRLREAGAEPGRPVVMVAAGSRDPRATDDLTRACELLAQAWGGPVELATLAGLGERPADVVRPGVVVSPYLLAPGHFADRCFEESAAADVVADVIGVHSAVVNLVVARVVGLRASQRSA